jgi:2-polyprenyl-6-methoxyphenol hydroxylase-like FAD-dependent oxidoreductase
LEQSVTQPVLVVGAGPVGLTAALSLAQQGVACRLIDRLPQRINQSRAAAIHARTCEQFERLGVIDPFLAMGVKVHGLHVMDRTGKTLLRNNLDGPPTAYDFYLGLGQDATERLLTEEVARHGVSVERSVTLTALAQTPDEVIATLVHGDGRDERVTTPYVVGCDGSKSVVRHQLGLTLEGETLDVYWVTADVRIDWPYPVDEGVAIPTPTGFIFGTPLPRGRWRLVVNMGENPIELPHEVGLEEVAQACDRVGVPVKLSDPTWISPFAINTRLVPTMQVGRVFLAGDASHLHSPVGGQGMNTGIQDAINLAWKLALVVKGRGTELLLDSYNTERHANAKRVLGFVGPATTVANLRHPVATRLRQLALRAVGQLGLTALAAQRISELDVHCRHSPVVGEHHQGTGWWREAMIRQHPHAGLFDCWDFGKGPHPGERAADAHGVTDGSPEPRRLYQDWVGDHRHQLLVFTGRQPTPERVRQLAELSVEIEVEWNELVRSRWVRPTDVPGPDGGLIDHEGEAHHLYGARYECLYLVRPDGHVGFRSQPAEKRALREHLGRILRGG